MKLNEIFKNKNLEKRDKVYFIAEIGVNHEGSINIAKKLIKEAKFAGADAVKFQTYKASKIASKYAKAYWDIKKEPTKNQFDLFKKYDSFNESDYKLLTIVLLVIITFLIYIISSIVTKAFKISDIKLKY